jgi:cell division protein FtsL
VRRARLVVACTVAVALAIATPLLMVKKQVYLRGLAIRRERLSDSLLVAGRDVAQLSIQMQKLSAASRIEAIARQKLGMDYPKAGQIVIVQPGRPQPMQAPGKQRGFLALMRRSLGGGRS